MEESNKRRSDLSLAKERKRELVFASFHAMINRIITGQGAGEYEMRNAINELLLLSVDAPHGSDREKVIRTHITEALEALDQSSYREQNRALLRELDLLYAYLNQGGLCEGRR